MANPREQRPILHTKKHTARLERERRDTRLILFAFIGILVVVAGLIGYAILYTRVLQARQPVAKIGKVSITIAEWQARVRLQLNSLENEYNFYQQYAQFGLDVTQQLQSIQAQMSDPTTLGQTVLDNMINEELIRQESAKRGITVSSAEVESAVQAAFSYYPNGSPTPTITPSAVSLPTLSPQTLALVTITPTPTLVLTATNSATPTLAAAATVAAATGTPGLTASPSSVPTSTGTPGPTDTPFPTSTPVTLQGYQKSYQQTLTGFKSIGLSEADVRLLYAANILRQRLMDVITANTPRTQDEVWARNILVADQATAKAVRQRIVGGEDFGKVAAEVSIDTGTKDQGGDLGWRARGTMSPEIDNAMFAMGVGQLSEPIKGQFGYYIIQVLDRANVTLDASAYEQARQTAFSAWLTQARKDYQVVTFDNWQALVPSLSTPIPTPAQ